VSLRLLSQGNTPTSDPHVRRAIAYAMNYERLWTVRGKDLVESDGPVPGTFLGGFIPPNRYEYNLEMARQELAQSGYPNGGFTISVVIPPEDPQQQTALEILQADLASLNIELDIQVRDWVPVYQQFLEWKSENDLEVSRDLQGLTLGMPPLVVDASNYMQIYDCESSLNFISYCNQEVDQLLAEADQAGEIEERIELYRQAIELILEDSPDIYLGLNNTIAVIRDDIKGFKIHRIWHPYGVDIDALSR
jgi:peptide/nickel transport system substrate-binding protein